MTAVFSETTVISSSSGFHLATARPLLYLARLTGQFPWSTSPSKLSCVRLILIVVYHLISVAYVAAQIFYLYVVIVPQVKSSANDSDGSSTLQAVLFYHHNLLALFCSLAMLVYCRKLISAVHEIDQVTRLFLTFWRKCLIIVLIILLCSALVLSLVCETLYGNVREAAIDVLVGYLSATWNMHGAYGLSWFFRVVPFINSLGVYLLQTAVIVVSFSVGLCLTKLSASSGVSSGFISADTRPPDPADVIGKLLETYGSLSRDYRMFAHAVSMLILALYLGDLIWILALIDRLIFGVRGTQFVTEWNQGGDWILLFLAGIFLVVRSVILVWVSDTAEL
ncbi:hypothetical protein RvY_06941-2 [Ramazzottius varieornatus]|uniref:Uncharacterized protein n=1 Tax=Ramazzottius varieornatus TaxID=947166 RepID=A0A1D1V6M1_RAMVA|nr:hypothetical protein RvY_06941-2 [Ramazzottius varieornatus]